MVSDVHSLWCWTVFVWSFVEETGGWIWGSSGWPADGTFIWERSPFQPLSLSCYTHKHTHTCYNHNSLHRDCCTSVFCWHWSHGPYVLWWSFKLQMPYCAFTSQESVVWGSLTYQSLHYTEKRNLLRNTSKFLEMCSLFSCSLCFFFF